MSKQFYKYLSDKLINFLNTNFMKAGERYYLQLDEKEQVKDFYDILSQDSNAEEFIYKHDKGEAYKTFCIKLNDIKLIVAATINVTSGYLVTIRNLSSLQKDEWENTALLIICGETLDSIKGGCSDLRREGMPFNVKFISSNLKDEINKSNLSKVDKEIAKFYIEKKLDDLYNTSLWDYEEILTILGKSSIDKEDYEKIGLFTDKSLETHTVKGIRKRLEDNYKFFESVENIQEYENKEEQLLKVFDEKGVDKLKKDNWRELDYEIIKKSVEANKVQDKPLLYIENEEKNITDEVFYWERAKSETASGRRKRNIIVFNNNSKEDIILKFRFDDTLNSKYIDRKSEDYMKVSGKTMIITLKSSEYDTEFYKLSYTHKNQTKSKYEFSIAVVNIDEKYLRNIKTLYEVNAATGKNGKRIKVISDGTEIKFGVGLNNEEVEIDETDDILNLKEDISLRISNSSAAWDEDTLRFILQNENGRVPIEIKEEGLRSKPIKSIKLWGYKREFKESFVLEENKIKQGTSEFYLSENLKETILNEKYIIDNRILYGVKKLNSIEKVELELSYELQNAYNNIIEYYYKNNTIPSLTYLNEEIIELYKKYLEIFNLEIETIQEREILSNNKKKLNLLKLGVIETESKIMFSPLAPINIAYQLEVYKQLGNEKLETHILDRLRINNLIPYIYGKDNKLYRPVHQEDNVEWIIFEKSEKVSIGETNAFIAKVVKEKLEQFTSHFNYLFIKNSNAPIKINLININNDKEIVRGVFEYIKKQITSNLENIIPVEIKIFNNNKETEFDKFFSESSLEKLEEDFNISFSSKNNEFDKIDLMRIALDNIKYYKNNTNDYSYAHISFYKSIEDNKSSCDTTSNMESGLSLNGLLSTITANNSDNDYRVGFGSKNLLDRNELLVKTVLNINEFAANLYNNSSNPYIKNTSIVTRPLILEEDVKRKLYNSSHWVTFIEPNFGLEYFERSNDNSNLVVIHYSDQYTTSEHFDTITVTNKIEQYKYIIKEFLANKNIELTDEKMNEVIKSFNSINGEWLLNLINNKSEYDREKLSIISALKYGLALLNHKDIIWIPISLEEILRISGAVKLNKSEGIFSIKNLKQSGVHSDDLIFIGVNISDINNINLYYYPVEVKVGYNFSNTIDKAKIQVDKTYNLLKEQLLGELNDNELRESGFKNKFFRNFFIQLLLSNQKKLIINNIWKEKELEKINEIKKYLLNDKYNISFSLEEFIGKGAIISFKKDNAWRSIKVEEEKLFIELTEEDAYTGIGRSVNDIYNEIYEGKADIRIDDLLLNKYIALEEKSKSGIIKEKDIDKMKETDITNKVDNDIEENIDFKYYEDKPIDNTSLEKRESSLNDVRILLGEAEGSTKKIYWEYGNENLANRHLLITGRSGQGKTYFIQSALKELASSKVPAVIIDYTEGFKVSQLEPEFKEYMGDRLKQFIVAKDKFPINPFKKGKKELDEGFYIEEDPADVAERFKSVIGAVYKDLGVQQLNSIYQAVIKGIKKYGNKFNLNDLKDELEVDVTSYSKTALAQLSLLIDKNPFDSELEFEWEELHSGEGNLFIIQLTSFTREVQILITEMILWDLWNYKAQHGSKDKPFVVILDEAQNLNFGENSPSTRILTEGRKFGWSAWFATQFLKGQMDKAAISRLQNSSEKIYFAQTEEEAVTVANIFAQNNEDKKAWAKKLINLEKGNCIAYGPIRSEGNKLLPQQPVKIKITSLTDRIK